MLPATPPVIVVVGPTAIGKTAVAIAIAQRLDGRAELLNADSVQIYRRLDIGSAKPSADERRQARFHLIDLVDPDQSYTLADYQRDALAAHGAVKKRGNATIVCGGTGLYVRSLTQPLGIPQAPPDERLRAGWGAYAAEHGVAALHHVLSARDPEAAAKLHVNDLRRIVRALEVLELTGRRLSDWHRDDTSSGEPLLPGAMLFGLNRDRARLYEEIDRRVDRMMSKGFEQEVGKLRADGYPRTLHSMRTLGYNELNAYLDAETTLQECIDAIKVHTRQFARRQLIWFRSDPRIRWVDTEGMDIGYVADRIMSLAVEKSAAAMTAETSQERIAK